MTGPLLRARYCSILNVTLVIAELADDDVGSQAIPPRGTDVLPEPCRGTRRIRRLALFWQDLEAFDFRLKPAEIERIGNS